jgi:phosphoribosylanthranilate isomerase
MAAVTLPVVTTYNDKGVKSAQLSLKGLMKSQLGAGLSAAALVQQLGKSLTAFAEDEKAQQQLKIAVQNSTGATDLQVAGLESQIKKMEMASAVSDDLLRPSMTTLVRATKDVTRAQDLLALALNISAGTGRDLTTVSLALARAENGQFGALTKLGVSLDANAVKAKDFDTIQQQLAISFKGASEAAADSTAGGMAKFQIVVDNLYEAVGEKLSPALNDLITIAGKVVPSATDKASGSGNKFTDALKTLVINVLPVAQNLKGLANILDLVAGESDKVKKSVGFTSAEFRLMDQLLTNKHNKTLQLTAAQLADIKKKQDDARKAAKEHATTLRDRVATAVKTVGENFAEAQKQLTDFANSTRDSIRSFVSLADAFKTQTDADAEITDALKARKDAYADLAKLNPVEDAEQYAEALQKVADAEKNVTDAQTTRAKSNYGQVFADQIAKAKEFATNLTTLAGQGLSRDGLAQLLNLGPVAGAQVTSEMIAGTGSLSLGALNAGLSDIAAAGQSLGDVAGNAFFGGNVAAGQAALTQARTYQISVNAGLVSNPAQVGRDIIEAIKSAERLSGQVFVSV